MKEAILIAAVTVAVVLIVITIRRLNLLFKAGQVSKSFKNSMTYIVILVPILGFLLTFTLSPKLLK